MILTSDFPDLDIPKVRHVTETSNFLLLMLSTAVGQCARLPISRWRACIGRRGVDRRLRAQEEELEPTADAPMGQTALPRSRQGGHW